MDGRHTMLPPYAPAVPSSMERPRVSSASMLMDALSSPTGASARLSSSGYDACDVGSWIVEP